MFPYRVWSMDTAEKHIYLTFDDGPHPTVTSYVLDQLKKYNARATFFCIGKNVESNPELYQRIINEGHQTGNHTHNHLNGWKTADDVYLHDVSLAARSIQSTLFRPPYGRLRCSQARSLHEYKIVMWDVLSGDFDKRMTKEKCLENVLQNTKPGSIVVFHDSEKAWDKLQYSLPLVLEHFSKKEYKFLSLHL